MASRKSVCSRSRFFFLSQKKILPITGKGREGKGGGNIKFIILFKEIMRGVH